MNYVPSHTFPDAAQQAEIWVSELSEHLHCERRQAYDCLRSVLHTLRDSMNQKAMADFSSQLPVLIRGMYYENWQPEGFRPCLSKNEFITQFEKRSKFKNSMDSEQAVTNVFKLLNHCLNAPTIKKIKSTMSASLDPLWPVE